MMANTRHQAGGPSTIWMSLCADWSGIELFNKFQLARDLARRFFNRVLVLE